MRLSLNCRSSQRSATSITGLMLLLALSVHDHLASRLVGAESVSLDASQIAPLKAVQAGLNYTLVSSDDTCPTTASTFMGAILCDADGYVTEIRISSYFGHDVYASIPSDISLLTRLSHIKIYNLDFGGAPVPASLGSIPNLVFLELSSSGLSGAIPNDLSTITNLKHLDLSRNSFSTLSSSIASLSSLEYLDLSSNVLDGPIPPELMTLTNLAHIDMGNNSLNGSIPDTVTNLRGLTNLDLSDNFLSGPIPAGLGSIPKLRNLWLGTGPECPKEYTSCVVEQSSGSQLCLWCSYFCSTCDKTNPLDNLNWNIGDPTTTITTTNNNHNNANATANSSSSGLSTGAIVGIVVGVLLLVVGVIATVFIIIQCGKKTEAVEVPAYAGGGQYPAPDAAPQGTYAKGYGSYQPDASAKV
ncbi:unnamed protein product [Closterium sp. NIES-65]|nr:unnamed protein product [Closterium sp. NIES-65]